MKDENLNTEKTANSDLGAVMHWVAVTDKLPPIITRVIGYFPTGNESGEIVSTAIMHNKGHLVSDFPNSTASYFEATHWMPLPEPPCA